MTADHETGRSQLRLAHVPFLTATVFAITLEVGIAQFANLGVLERLERTPAALHGDWWRTATALVVQDGGLVGTAANLLFLAAIGTLAEQILPRSVWLAHYVGVGVATEFVAYFWEPVGAGNSVAVCGLTGAVAVGWWRADERLPGWTGPVLLLWAGALVGTEPHLTTIAIVAAAIAAGITWNLQERGRQVRGPVAVVVVAAGISLAAVTNIHGAALLLGLALAALSVPKSPDRLTAA